MKEAASCLHIMFRAAVAAGAVLSGFHCAFADIPASAYIQNGLIAQWDGIDNAGTGTHDPNATTWKELKGDLVTVATALTFRDGKSAYFNGTSGSGTLITGSFPVALEAIRDGAFTAEVYFKPLAYTQYAGIFHFGVNGAERYFSLSSDFNAAGGKGSVIGAFQYKRDSWNAANCYSGAIASLGECHHVGCIANGRNHTIVVDGETISTHSAGTLDNYGSTNFQIGKYANNNPRQKMDLFGIRLYDRILTAEEAACNANIDKIRFDGADPAALTWPEGWKFEDGSLFKNVKIRVRCGSGEDGYGVGGTISISGGEALSETAMWRECNSTATVQLSATAAEGYEFVGWSGVSAESMYEAEIETVIYEDVTAVFKVVGETYPREYTWVGGSGAVWDDPGNWEDADGFAGVPAAGDAVMIPSGAKVTLTNSTPVLASISVSGTVTFTNWMTRLNATSVTVMNGGVLTCHGPYTTSEMSNRVWVACTDFNLLSGGKVNVSEKGWGNAVESIATQGPGQGTFASGGGAYGGYGGYSCLGSGRVYGSVSEPTDPGSLGLVRNYSPRIAAAGGAVFIDASGTVVLNGSVTADGRDGHADTSYFGAASGGSILIRSKKITAQGGVVTSTGGHPYSSNNNAWPGGGGRIAIHYDPLVQSEDDIVSLTVSARPGNRYYAYSSARPHNHDPDYYNGDVGSVYFSDTKFLKLLGKSLSGQLYFPSEVTSYTTDSLEMKTGWVRFAKEGFKVDVLGDLTIDGTNTRLEMGGNKFPGGASYYFVRLFSGSIPWSLSVGGDMKVSGGALVRCFPSSTNGTDVAFGGYIDVGGTLTVTGRVNDCVSSLYLGCCPTNGGAVKVSAKNVYVASNALVSAYLRGFQYGKGTSPYYSGNHQSQNGNLTTGAGHGGAGNNINSSSKNTYKPTAGRVYDDELRPLMPGSAGYVNWNCDGTSPLCGGGVVYLKAKKKMIIDGRINANALLWATGEGHCRFACASGGSVLLESKEFFMGESAVISAAGAGISSSNANFYNAGLGGGGRIAVYTGAAYVEGETKRRRLEVSSEKPASYLGSFSVAGGEFKDKNGYSRKYVKAGDMLGNVVTNGVLTDLTGVAAESAGWYACPLAEATIRGGDGTIRFVNVPSDKGFMLIVK